MLGMVLGAFVGGMATYAVGFVMGVWLNREVES